MRGVARARTLISSKVPVRHLALLGAVLIHGVTDAARQEVGEELKRKVRLIFIPNSKSNVVNVITPAGDTSEVYFGECFLNR